MNLSYRLIISVLLALPSAAIADLPTTVGGFQCKVSEAYAGETATWEISARLPLRVGRGAYDPLAGNNYYNETIVFASRVLPTNIDITLGFNRFLCRSSGAPLVEFPCENVGYEISAKYLDQSLTIPPADFFINYKAGNLPTLGNPQSVQVKLNKPVFDYSAEIECSVHHS